MTTRNTCCLLLVVIATAAIICAFAPSPAAADPYLCPWRTVAHPEDPFIQKLGSWAVEQQHTVMRFKKVESAKAQGIGQCTSMTRNYELIIVAAIRGGPATGPPTPGGDDDEKYRAVVYVTNFTQPQKVISFSHDSPAAN